MSQKCDFHHKQNNLEYGGKAGHEDFPLFPHCFKGLSFLNTGKIVYIFHPKANDEGGGNSSNQHFLISFVVFVKNFFLSGIKNRDCLEKESDVEEREKTMHWVSLTYSFYFLKM